VRQGAVSALGAAQEAYPSAVAPLSAQGAVAQLSLLETAVA
jgi:hypothetical protein